MFTWISFCKKRVISMSISETKKMRVNPFLHFSFFSPPFLQIQTSSVVQFFTYYYSKEFISILRKPDKHTLTNGYLICLQQSTWMSRGRSVKNASQSTWSPPPKPNSSPVIFVDASDPKMITSVMTSPHSIPSHQMMHPEKTKQPVPFGSSSLSSSPLISPSPATPSTPPIGPADPEKNPSGISSLAIVSAEENPKTDRQNMEGSQQSHATEQPIQRLLNAVC